MSINRLDPSQDPSVLAAQMESILANSAKAASVNPEESSEEVVSVESESGFTSPSSGVSVFDLQASTKSTDRQVASMKNSSEDHLVAGLEASNTKSTERKVAGIKADIEENNDTHRVA